MFAISLLLLACHFHSCSVMLLSPQKHFCFVSVLRFLFACVFLSCSAFDHLGTLDQAHILGNIKF